MTENNKDKYDYGPKSFGLSARSTPHNIQRHGSTLATVPCPALGSTKTSV
jgi:hypothetical protein